MILKRVVIDDFGHIDHLEQRFNDGLTVVRSVCSKDMMLAITWALSYPVSDIGSFDELVKKGTNIRLEVDDPKETGLLNKAMLSGQCRESLSCRILTRKNRTSYVYKLRDYKYPDDHYKNGVFKDLTDNFGCSKAFRAYLFKYIKEHNESIASGSPGTLIDGNGVFVFDKDNASVSDMERFRFDCFLAVNDCWKGASELHGPYLPKLPLLIEDSEKMHISGDHAVKARLKEFGDQAIVFRTDGQK